jgi:hypothetical protein
MLRVVVGRRDDGVRGGRGEVVERPQTRLDDAVEPAARQLQIALIGEHDGASAQARERGEQRRLELRHVHVDHVALADAGCRIGGKARHDHALAQLAQNRHAHDLDAVDALALRQRGIEACRQHRHRVAAPRQPARQTLGVDRQAADVRAVVGEGDENTHQG